MAQPAGAAAAAERMPFSAKAGAQGVPSKDLFYTGIHARNIGMVRKLLEVVLPVPFSEDFFRRLQTAPIELARLVYYRDICVGVLGCWVDTPSPAAAAAEAAGGGAATAAAPRVYMSVLAVLAPYRDRGIGSALVQGVLEAMEGGKIPGAEGAREMYLHVWEENKEAVKFYERAGFVADPGRVENYYKRLHNPHAIVLRKHFTPPSGSS